MAERSGFFPYAAGDSNSEYTSDWLAKYIASFISNGTYNGEMGITADGSAMSVTLPAGRAWINGYHYRNDGPLTLPVDNADGVLHRKDTVILRWDVNARSITAQVLKGTPASSPIAPTITRSAEQYDLKIAEISIPAGTTAITQALITDTRLDNDVCGIVTGVVQQVDTTTLYQQIQDDLTRFRTTNEADFNAWVASLKDVLDDNTAGNLLNLINGHTGNSDIHVTALQKTMWDAKAAQTDIDYRDDITDGNDTALLTCGTYALSNVSSNHPFGKDNAGNYVLITIDMPQYAHAIWFRQIAIKDDTGEILQREVQEDSVANNMEWFPKHDDRSTDQHYIQNSDGSCVQWGRLSASVTISTAYGSSYIYNYYGIDLPVDVLSGASVFVTAESSGIITPVGARLKPGSTNRIEFNLLSPISVSALPITFSYMVRGFWRDKPVG